MGVMARSKRSKPVRMPPKRSGVTFGGFLAMNALPVIGGIVIAFLYFTGRITFREVPPGVLYLLGGMGAGIVLLSLLCWLLMPLLTGAQRAVHRSLGETARAMRKAGFFGRIGRAPIWLVTALLFLFFWIQTTATRALVALNIIVLILVVGLLVWEVLSPDSSILPMKEGNSGAASHRASFRTLPLPRHASHVSLIRTPSQYPRPRHFWHVLKRDAFKTRVTTNSTTAAPNSRNTMRRIMSTCSPPAETPAQNSEPSLSDSEARRRFCSVIFLPLQPFGATSSAFRKSETAASHLATASS